MDNNVNYVPQVDYTSRDYAAIRSDLLTLIDYYNNEYSLGWTSRDTSDLGIVLLEMFAYMGDNLNFYIDRAANEGFLDTASQRDSVLRIAQMLGYTPTTSTAASTTLTFANYTDTGITVPAGAQVATTTMVDGTSTQIIFETDESVYVYPLVGAGIPGLNSVTATQGETVPEEQIGVSNGTASQVFKLSQSPVIKDSISITVNGIQYRYSSSLIDNSIYDPVFTTQNSADGETYVIFGDGVGGRIPPAAGVILATYRTGNGAAGNVAANSITEILNTNSVWGDLIVFNEAAATGGADEESTDSIRINAPLAMRATNRAVSLKDYGYLALQVSGVAKAIANSTSFNSINLYIAPFGGTGVWPTTTGGHTAGDPTPAFTQLANKVASYFTDKAAPNVSLTVLPPTYVPVSADITVHVLPQYRQDVVLPQAEAAIKTLVATSNSFFADVIPSQFLMNAISAVPGVAYSTVEYLRRNDKAQTFSVNSWSRTSNIATVVTTATHNITVGQTVKITNTNVVDGTYVVTAVTSTNISFGNVGGNVSSTSISPVGTVRAMVVETIECVVNEIPSAGTFTLTATGGIA